MATVGEFRESLLSNETLANTRNTNSPTCYALPLVGRVLIKLCAFSVLLMLFKSVAWGHNGSSSADFQLATHKLGNTSMLFMDLAATFNAASGGHHGQLGPAGPNEGVHGLPGVFDQKKMPYPMSPATPEVCKERGGTFKGNLTNQYPWLKGCICQCHFDATQALGPELALYFSANVAFAWALNKGNPEVYPFAATFVQVLNAATVMSLLVVWLSQDLLRLCLKWPEVMGQILPFCSFVMVLLWGAAKVSGPIPVRVRIGVGDEQASTDPEGQPATGGSQRLD